MTTALAAIGLMMAVTVGAALTAAPAAAATNVTLCHRTGSAPYPYVALTLTRAEANAHINKRHDVTLDWPKSGQQPGTLQVAGDFIRPLGAGCANPPAGLAPGPAQFCVVSGGVTQTPNTVTGTAGDDTINCGTPAAFPGKTINGGSGNDTITGTRYGDKINGGNGNDTVTGGPGLDVIEGGNGNDTLTGNEGRDLVTDNGDGSDTITP